MNKKQNSNNAENQQLNIADVINRLFDLPRYDIKAKYGCLGLITTEKIEYSGGEFVKYEDVRKLITEIRISNGL